MTADSGLGGANFAAGKGEMVALDFATGHVLWDTQLPQMPDGAATVATTSSSRPPSTAT
jgi:hypothetical protein